MISNLPLRRALRIGALVLVPSTLLFGAPAPSVRQTSASQPQSAPSAEHLAAAHQAAAGVFAVFRANQSDPSTTSLRTSVKEAHQQIVSLLKARNGDAGATQARASQEAAVRASLGKLRDSIAAARAAHANSGQAPAVIERATDLEAQVTRALDAPATADRDRELLALAPRLSVQRNRGPGVDVAVLPVTPMMKSTSPSGPDFRRHSPGKKR
jgi:hypothetical protein